MPTPSPLCLVADGAGPFNPTFPDGLDITHGDTVSVVLAAPAGVTNWYLQVGLVVGNPPVVVPGTGLDEVTPTPPPLTGVSPAGLVLAGPTGTVTFTFPNAAGRTLLFSSTVTGTFGAITTTFALFSRTGAGYRVGATGMTREGSNASGWTSIVNPAIRGIGSGGGGSPPWQTTNVNLTLTQAAENWVLLDSNTSIQSYTPLILTFPASAHDGDIVVVKWTSVGIDPGGHFIPASLAAQGADTIEDPTLFGSATATVPLFFLPQAAYYKYDLATTMWRLVGFVPQIALFNTVPSPRYTSPHQMVPGEYALANSTGGGVTLYTPNVFPFAQRTEFSVEWVDGSNAVTIDPHGTFTNLENPNAAPGTFVGANLPVTLSLKGFYTWQLDFIGGGRWLLKTRPSAPSASAPTGDNADALRSGAVRPLLADAQNGFELVVDTSLNPQFDSPITDGTGPAGADLVISERKLLTTGMSGAFVGLFSIELAGNVGHMENDLRTAIPSISSPFSLAGVGVPYNFFNTISVSREGLVTMFLYESIFSTTFDLNLSFTAGAEDWSNSHACFVYQDSTASFGSDAEIYWTAPNANKLYQANIGGNFGDPTAYSFPGEEPWAICAAGDNTFWVSFVAGTPKLRHYKVTPTSAYPYTTVPTITQIGPDVPDPGSSGLLFDGKYLWALTPNLGSFGGLSKYDQSGNLVGSFLFPNGPSSVQLTSRMCFDGTNLWVTLATTVLVFPGEGAVAPLYLVIFTPSAQPRGIVCDPYDGTIYVAAYTSNLKIYAYHRPRGGIAEERKRTAVWSTNRFSMGAATSAVAIGSFAQGNWTRTFEFEITAQGLTGSPRASAYWKQIVTVIDDGSTMTILGSVSDVVPPRLNPTAVSVGYTVSISGGGQLLTMTINSNTDTAIWSVGVKEVTNFGGAL